MINNRQNGRRRGRGGGGNNGPRQGGGGQGQRDSGNRIDSRARGNAAQLLEKYRNMARDAQMSGDRVNTEYYLQFADHYFRVLADQRGRADDQQPRARQRDDFDHFGGSFDTGFDGPDDFVDEGETIRAEEQPRGNENEPRNNEPRNEARPPREARRPRNDDERRPRTEGRGEGRSEPRGEGRYEARDEGRGDQRGEQRYEQRGDTRAEDRYADRQPEATAQPAADVANDAVAPVEAERAPRRRAMRKPREEHVENGGPIAIDADRLPPAFGAAAAVEAPGEVAEDAPKPRRRRVRTAAVEVPPVG